MRLSNISDGELFAITRFPRTAIQELCDILRGDLERETHRSCALPVDTQVLTALQFYSSGSFQWMVDDSVGLSQPAVSRVIDRTTKVICKLADSSISFPTVQQNITANKLAFNRIAGFPNVIGAIDCTHIRIKAPSVSEESFVNRKGFHTVNIQAVCDADMKLLNVVAKWPGSSHDSFIWRNCSLHSLFENGHIQGGLLLGDSGYPLEPWLMTPITGPRTPSESAYNMAHAKTRCVVERCFGVLKSRFRCLDNSGGTLLYTAERACRVFVAASVLHNFCITRNIPTAIDADVAARNANIQPMSVPGPCQQQVVVSGADVRRRIIQQYY